MALTLAVALTFAVAADPYVQDGYNPPEVKTSKVEASPTTTVAPEPIVQAAAGLQRMGNGTSDVEQWRPLVAGHFPSEQVENALCVIKSESGGNAGVDNLQGSAARGLFQIMTTVWADEFGFSPSEFYEPEKNTYAAVRIWERSGWQPWSPRTRRNCGL